MISLEDRLRAVLRDTAREVPPESVRPLDLMGPTRAKPSRSRRGSRALTALSAAAAVTGLVVVSAVLAASPRAHHPAGSTPPRSAAGSGQAADPQALPPYFLQLTGTGYPFYDNPLHAAIKATASGAILAVITPPAPNGTFIGVTAAGDDRTFVLAAQPWQPHDTSYAVGLNSGPVTFYLLRFSPGDARPALTRLPIPAIPASEQVAGLALAPDSSQLAVATNAGMNSQQISIYSVSTGAAQTWTAHVANAPLGGMGNGAQNLVDPQALSWTADGTTLAYQAAGSTPGVDLLNVSGTSGSLSADSRLIAPQAGGGGSCISDVVITPDGSAIVCPVLWPASTTAVPGKGATTSPTASGAVRAAGTGLGFAEFSASTGALLRVLEEPSDPGTNPFTQQVLWSSPSGSEVIAESALPYWNRVSVLTAGQLTLLPLADQPAVPAAVW